MADHAPIDQQVQRLEKEMATARESYEAVLKRYDNATVSRALGIFEFPERVKIIDAPQDPAVPVTPPKVIFFILGILAGVGLGISLATVAELLDQNVRTADELELLTKLPVIARLPKVIALEPDLRANRAGPLPPDRNAILSPG
jgi:capsular polysaccharide biosynthesis protein